MFAFVAHNLREFSQRFMGFGLPPPEKDVPFREVAAVRLGGCSWQAFEDGFPNLTIDAADVDAIENGAECAFLACLDTPAAVFPGRVAIFWWLSAVRLRGPGDQTMWFFEKRDFLECREQ